jgi:GntR family transcriptional regulator / MocR family aminotransferase
MDLMILLDKTLNLPLHQQLYEGVQQAILTGKLRPGEKLPSTRVLAHLLGISRGTVKLGYEQLLILVIGSQLLTIFLYLYGDNL